MSALSGADRSAGSVDSTRSLPGWPDRSVSPLPSVVSARWPEIGDQVRRAVQSDRGDAGAGEQLPRGRPEADRLSRAVQAAVVDIVSDLLFRHADLADSSVVTSAPDPAVQEIALDDLPLPTRARNCLRTAGLVSVRDLVGLRWRDLLELRNFGVKMLVSTVCTLEYLLANPDQKPRGHQPSSSLRVALPPDPVAPPSDPVELAEWLQGRMGAALDARQHRILTRRYGLDGESIAILDVLGGQLGISRERVRQIQVQALRKLLARLRRDPTGEAIRRFLLAEADPRRAAPWALLAQEVWPGAPVQAGGFLFVLAAGTSKARQQWDELLAKWNRELEAEARATRVRMRRENATARGGDRLAAMINDCWWPAVPRTGRPATLAATRVPRRDEDLTIEWSSAKLGRKLLCDSLLERRFFELCELAADIDRYCEQPVRIEYVLAGRHRVYHPDALVHLTDGRMVLVEVKPLYQASLLRNLSKWSAAREWCREHGIGSSSPTAEFRSAPGSLDHTETILFESSGIVSLPGPLTGLGSSCSSRPSSSAGMTSQGRYSKPDSPSRSDHGALSVASGPAGSDP